MALIFLENILESTASPEMIIVNVIELLFGISNRLRHDDFLIRSEFHDVGQRCLSMVPLTTVDSPSEAQ